MRSRATPRFWSAFKALPPEIQERARVAYQLFRQAPSHPSLRFKRVNAEEPIYAARITRDYRAVGLLEQEGIAWFWIGNHEDYDRLLARL